MKTFQWGILGCGKIAGKFAAAVASLDGMMVHAAAARNGERADTFAREHNIPHAYGSYKELLQDEALDAVYIATVNSQHYQNIMLAVNHGVPVLCEKPMLMKTAEFDQIVKRAKEKNVALMEAMWTVFLPSIQKIKAFLQNGAIGAPQLSYVNLCVPFARDLSSRLYNPALGGGLTFDIGVYNLHTALYLFGEHFTQMGVCGHQAPTGVDDRASISFSYPNGLVVQTLTADINGPRDLQIYGETGSILADRFNAAEEFTWQKEGGISEKILCPFDCNGFEYEIKEFASVVTQGRLESETLPLSRSRKVCEIMEQAYQMICVGKI